MTTVAPEEYQLDRLYKNIQDGESAYKVAELPHNAKLWTKWSQRYAQEKKSDALKAMRVAIQEQTFKACANFTYSTEEKNQVVFTDKKSVTQAAQATVLYSDKEESKLISAKREAPKKYPSMLIEALEGDCLEVAIAAMKNGKCERPAVLNMASARRAGGGYRNGAGAQEENLFRRSNYYQVLEDPGYVFDPNRKWGYPLPEVASIYSPSVKVFRSSEATGYKFLDTPVDLSFVAVSAYVRPALEPLKYSPYPSIPSAAVPQQAKSSTPSNSSKPKQGNQFFKLNEKFADKTKRKIRMMFLTAMKHGNDGLILSAFGCGAFENPANHIASLFKEVITEFKGYFKYVAFAVIEDHNSRKPMNPIGNFLPFKLTFGEKMVLGEEEKKPAATGAAASSTTTSTDNEEKNGTIEIFTTKKT